MDTGQGVLNLVLPPVFAVSSQAQPHGVSSTPRVNGRTRHTSSAAASGVDFHRITYRLAPNGGSLNAYTRCTGSIKAVRSGFSVSASIHPCQAHFPAHLHHCFKHGFSMFFALLRPYPLTLKPRRCPYSSLDSPKPLCYDVPTFHSSSTAEQSAVNRWVPGSNPGCGAS